MPKAQAQRDGQVPGHCRCRCGRRGLAGMLGVRGPELGAGSCCDSFASLALLPSAAPQSCSLPAAACGNAEAVAMHATAR